MGKNKSQRTKGNTKPSNSGRTAELLSARGVNTFLGFGTLPVDLPGFSSPIAANKTDCEDTDVSVDSDFRLVLRKTAKRDTVTKVKALQEFSQLCQEKDDEAVKRVLPFWPRIFCKLAIDFDRKVREAVHQAHKNLVSKVKKNLAPYLKSLMGVWLISMCDPYAPAACAANQAFQIAFPSSKQGEALDYCKEEVFNYIEDILFEQTVDTISDPKISSRDERETQYLRLVASSFNGLHFFLHTSSSKNTTEDSFKKLLNNSKYWKYATHKDPEVKRGWYSTAQALCQFIQPLIKENASKLSPLTLGSLDEENPLVAATIWESSLRIMVTLEDYCQYINVKNDVLPKLFKVLKEGGKGNASAIFHNLLPFLSKFPDSSIEPKIEFYTDFFGSLREGMKLENVRTSSRELNTVIKAYFECLRYSLFKNTGSLEEAQCYRNHLIINELVSLVKDGMLDKNSDSYSNLFDHLGEFLRYCEEQSCTENIEGAIPQNVLSIYFENTQLLLVELLESEGEVYSSQLSKYFYHLHYGKESLTSKKGVRFATSDQDKTTKIPSQKRKSLKSGPLTRETVSFCQNVLAKLTTSPSLPLLKLFAQIIVSIPSEELFNSLLRDSDIPTTDEPSVIFVKELLLPMLKNSNSEDNEGVKCLVSMVVAALSCTSETTAVQTLNNLCDEGDTLVLSRLIQEASELRNSDSRLANWLRGEYIGQAMVKLAEELSNQLLSEGENENELAWTLLNICFSTNREFDPFIASDYVNKILSSFTKSLSNIKPNVIYKQPETSFKIVKLVCDLAKNLFSQCQGCWYLPSAEALLLSLFKLSCKINDEGQTNSISIILEETWVLGAEKLVELQGTEVKHDGFLRQALETIKRNLISKKWKYNELNDIEKLSKRVENLLKAYAEGLKNTEEETWEIDFTRIIPWALDIVLPDQETWIELENDYLTLFKLPRTLCVLSLLDLPLIEISLASLEDDLPSFLALAHFTSKLLDIMYEFKIEAEESSVDLSLKRFQTSSLLSRHIPSLAMGVAFASNVYIEPRISKEHEIRKLFNEIPHTLSTCVKNLDDNEILPMMDNTLKRANDGSYPHAITLSVLYQYFLEINPKVQDWLAESVNVEQILGPIKDKGTNVPHVIYCLMPHFDSSTVVKLVKMVTDMLLSDEQVSTDNDCWILGTLAVCINSDNEEIINDSEIQDCTKNVLSYFSDLWRMDPNILNPNWSTKYPASLQKTTFVSQLCSIFIAVVKKYPQTLDQDSWDAILCTLVGWIQRNNELWEEFLTEETAAIPSILSFKLLSEIEGVLNRCRSGSQELELLPNLLTEWEELYLENIYAQIVPLFIKLGEALKSKKPHLVLEKLLTTISQSLLNVPANLIIKSSKEILPKKFGDDLAKNLNFLLEKLHSMLISSHRSLTLGSHSLLISLMVKVPETNIGEDNSEDEEKSRAPPKSLILTLEMTNQVVDTLLSNFNIGDCCLVQPYTDSFTFTYVYMLSWMELLKLFSSSTSEIRSEYACYLQQKSKLLEELLQNLFKLMPNNPLLVHDNLKGSQIKTMFAEPFQIDLEAEASFSELQKVSCHVYLTTLRQLPALVRQWWHNRDKCSSDFVNRFTTNFVSRYICEKEIKAVQDTETKFSNMVVKARPMAREVVAKYTMEDITFELVIKLPANHPLGPVTIETGQRIGVSSTQWRNWMLQLTTFLSYQNGSILDGLSLWKRNVDKRFEGIEECMICFYVLHGATLQLPKLTCRTCKKRFHSACLFKWFSTSQNSSCPLCRNLF